MENTRELYSRSNPVISGFVYTDKEGNGKVCLKYVGKKKNPETGYRDDVILQEHILLTKYVEVMKLKSDDMEAVKSSFAGLILERKTNISSQS